MEVYGSIYGLHDPRTGELRYIGQTTVSLKERLWAHLSPSSRRKAYYSARWIDSLVRDGVKPEIRLLAEAGSNEDLDRLEIKYIAAARSRKGKLVGAVHHQYRHDISTDLILARLAEGSTKVAIAKELGVSPTFVHRRLKQPERRDV